MIVIPPEVVERLAPMTGGLPEWYSGRVVPEWCPRCDFNKDGRILWR
jgi:hypothetical protein